jgi:hypothetical protein
VSIFSRAEKAATLMALATPVVASSLLLGGCMSSPTYGTDKTANEQLVNDITSMVSLQPKRKAPIDYQPRPDLVKPASSKDLALPAPQDQMASAANPDWPESPEQRRARIRKEADANDGKPGYDSPVVADADAASRAVYTPQPSGIVYGGDASGVHPVMQERAQREEVRRRLAENRQGSATNRKYLSEPPLEYRQAASTAPVDDIGEDEIKKERRAKKAAKKGGSSWRDYVPWL